VTKDLKEIPCWACAVPDVLDTVAVTDSVVSVAVEVRAEVREEVKEEEEELDDMVRSDRDGLSAHQGGDRGRSRLDLGCRERSEDRRGRV
jgi:hypothetical protein